MFEAQYLMTKSTEGESVFSPWFPRQGDCIRATLDVIQLSNATLVVEVFTKNSEDTNDGDNADSGGTPTSITATGPGRSTQEWSRTVATTIGLEELVRYKFTIKSEDGSLAWVLFRMVPPAWFDAVLPQP